jgi:hypothetical protein
MRERCADWRLARIRLARRGSNALVSSALALVWCWSGLEASCLIPAPSAVAGGGCRGGGRLAEGWCGLEDSPCCCWWLSPGSSSASSMLVVGDRQKLAPGESSCKE